MVQVVSLASRKGGSGKTTLSGHIAVQAHRAGFGPVAIMDFDPQGSLADWWNTRKNEDLLFVNGSPGTIEESLAELREMEVALLVIDTPPALGTEVRVAAMHSDLVLVPTRPSPHDLRSVGATVQLVESVGKPVIFVLNGATPRARITDQALKILSEHGPLAPKVIHQRVDFASSMIDGRTVMEINTGSRSAEEVEGLWNFLDNRLSGAHHGRLSQFINRLWSDKEATAEFHQTMQGVS